MEDQARVHTQQHRRLPGHPRSSPVSRGSFCENPGPAASGPAGRPTNFSDVTKAAVCVHCPAGRGPRPQSPPRWLQARVTGSEGEGKARGSESRAPGVITARQSAGPQSHLPGSWRSSLRRGRR